MPNTAENILTYLSKIQLFNLEYRCFLTNSFSKGNGVVVITKKSSRSLVIYEKGEWVNLDKNVSKFTNVYSWVANKTNDILLLSHQRQGLHQPLFDFCCEKQLELEAINNYSCGKDLYKAQLKFNQTLQLDILVRGPKKHFLLSYNYS